MSGKTLRTLVLTDDEIEALLNVITMAELDSPHHSADLRSARKALALARTPARKVDKKREGH